MIQNEEIHTNNKKCMTLICKKNLSDNGILDNTLDKNINEESININNNDKNLNRKLMKNINININTLSNKANNINNIIKPKIKIFKNRISLPKIILKKNIK